MQRFTAAVADQQPVADAELVAARMTAKFVVIVEDEDARIRAESRAVVMRGGQAADPAPTTIQSYSSSTGSPPTWYYVRPNGIVCAAYHVRCPGPDWKHNPLAAELLCRFASGIACRRSHDDPSSLSIARGTISTFIYPFLACSTTMVTTSRICESKLNRVKPPRRGHSPSMSVELWTLLATAT